MPIAGSLEIRHTVRVARTGSPLLSKLAKRRSRVYDRHAGAAPSSAAAVAPSLVALHYLYVVVRTLVPLPAGAVGKSTAAHVASVRALARVGPPVHLEVRVQRKGTAAHVTAEGLFARVRAHVEHQGLVTG